MIMVIFGAGASYDSVPSRPPELYTRGAYESRLPLANELFLDTDLFNEGIERFNECKPIIPYLRSIPPGATLEHELEVLQEEGKTDPVRLRQLAAIRFYLRYVIWRSEVNWNDVARGVTNHVAVFDQLRRVRADNVTVLLVTFNYDTMIETALLSSPINLSIGELQHYVQNDAFKLFKLHGSVNWAREIESEVIDISSSTEWQVANQLIYRAPDLKISDRFITVPSNSIGKVGNVPVYPGIAIPVETKSNFECPSDHLDCLCKHLGKVTNVVTIGWSAQEQHFLKLLKEHLTEEISIYSVAAGKQDAEAVLQRIKAAGICVKDEEAALGGFTECTAKREFEKFLTMVRSPPNRPIKYHTQSARASSV